jgi:hypothetical protein
MGARSVAAAAVVGAALLVAAVAVVARGAESSTALPCRVTADGAVYRLSRDQVANATVITDAAASSGMPHHAVTVALAAALQESQLHNLRHGDRDSLGLFQQRPSQGWGSPAQIMTPRLAAESFFRALARVDQWQTLSVNAAAQLVQHSATPTAYADSEREARAIARATTGELPGTLTCTQ